MQRVLVALALGSAAAFAPAAQPRTSVVRFMDEDALKSAASVVIIYSIYHRRGDPMGDALSESALARGASSSTRSMSDALSESALSRHAIAQEQDLERRSRRVQQDRRRRGRDRDARGHQVRGADSRQGHGPLGRRVRHHRLRGRDEGRLRQQRHGQRRAGLDGLRSRAESRNTFTPSTTRVVRATHRSFHTEDYYAGFEDAPEWVTVEPAIGKLDRRGGAETTLTVTACPPPVPGAGQGGAAAAAPGAPAELKHNVHAPRVLWGRERPVLPLSHQSHWHVLLAGVGVRRREAL